MHIIFYDDVVAEAQVQTSQSGATLYTFITAHPFCQHSVHDTTS